LPHDYASRVAQPAQSESTIRRMAKIGRRTSRATALLAVAAGGVGLLAMLLGGPAVDARVSPVVHEEWLDAEALARPENHAMRKVVLKEGDAVVTALSELGFPYAEILNISRAAEQVYSLKRVYAGHAFYRKDGADTIDVYYDVDHGQQLHLSSRADHEGWQAEMVERPVSSRQVQASGVIDDSLFAAAAAAGMDERTTMNLVDIFAWDIDFARDLRRGDRFTVLYEERYNEKGQVVGSDILAAEFINQGERYSAIRYTLANGKTDYFSLDGKSVRKTYLKSPVKFSRISSRFTLHRKHPVLGYTRAHRGVDYAAVSGTPIHAIGDGTVIFAGWKGGYGRVVQIRHTNGNHVTVYAHMRGFGRGIKRGVHVRQGQTIGYVGMTGLATGPHLHFEFRIRGRAVNPLTVKHVAAKPVPATEMTAFHHFANNLADQLEQVRPPASWG